MASLKVGSLGEFIHDQRRSAQYSLRQLAAATGVSNPYLSQIERGLKKPSAEVLQQIAKALQISAETLYVRAGILEERDGASDVVAAVLGDTALGERHKRVLIDIYQSFRREHADGSTSTTTNRPTKSATARTTSASKTSTGRKKA